MKKLEKLKIGSLDNIPINSCKVVNNSVVINIILEFLWTYYHISFEVGLCFLYSDTFNYYIGGSNDFYGYLKLNKIWLSYTIYKSYILKLNKVVKMLLKN